MKKEENSLTPEGSLAIITEMIGHVKGHVQSDSFYFLFWGWMVMLANLTCFTLLEFTAFGHPYVVWLAMIPAWIFVAIRSSRKKNEYQVTHLDKVHTALWIAYGVCIPVVVFFGFKINYNINPLVLLMSAVPAFVSGVIISFRPLLWGGALFWAASIGCFFLPMRYQFLLTAAAIAIGYLVPGYLLKKQHLDV